MYVIGEVKKDGLFAVASVMHRAAKDFNFYVEYEVFMKGRKDVTKEEVMAWMDTLGQAIEATEEHKAEYMALSHKEQQAIDFQFSGGATPNKAGLEFILNRFPNIADFADHYQLLTLISNLDFETPLGPVHLILEEFGQRSGEPGVVQALKELTLAVTLPTMKEERDRIIAEHGYAISPVVDEKANYAFTISGDTAFGTELLCVQGKADPVLICSLLGCVIALIQEGKQVLEINDTIATMKDGTEMRYRLVKAEPILALGELGELGSIKADTALVQLVVADINNLLPGEEGYDSENFYQPVFELVKADAEEGKDG